MALAGLVRDILVALPAFAGHPAHLPYNAVFTIEIVFLALAILVAAPLVLKRFRTSDPLTVPNPKPVEAT